MPRVISLAPCRPLAWLASLGCEVEPTSAREFPLDPAGVDALFVPGAGLAPGPARRALLAAAAQARRAGIPTAVDLDLSAGPGAPRESLVELVRGVLGPGATVVVRPGAETLFPSFFTPEAIAEGLLDLGAEVAVLAPPGGKAVAATRERAAKKGPTPELLDRDPEARHVLFAGFLLEWLASHQAGRALERALAALPDRLARGPTIGGGLPPSDPCLGDRGCGCLV